MKRPQWLSIALAGFFGAAVPAGFAAQGAEPTTLSIFARRHARAPFRQVSALFEKQNPNVTVQAQFGGSVKMAKQITDLHQDADLLAVADYNVIPKYNVRLLTPPHAAWYASIALQRDHLRLYRQEQVRQRDQFATTGTRWLAAQGRRDRPLQSGHRPVGLSDRADARI